MNNSYTHISVRSADADDSLTEIEQRQLADAIAYISQQAVAKVTKADITAIVPETGEPMVSIAPDMSILKKFDHVSVFSMSKMASLLRDKFNGPEEPMAYGDFIDEEDS